MLVAAALVPETALLVPGAAGRAEVLTAERAAVLQAVGVLVAAEPDRVLLVGAAPRPLGVPMADGARHLAPGDPVTLGPAGVDDGALRWTAPDEPSVRTGPPGNSVATAVGRRVLGAGGWTGPVDLVGPDDATAAGAGRTALLLVGSLSARRGPDGPLPDDPRARDVEDVVVADLVDLGPEARRRLADLPAALAEELAISARPLWRRLVDEVERDGRRWEGVLHSFGAPFGATYAVLTWTPERPR